VDSRRRTACEPVSCLISRPEASCECDTAAPNAKLVGVLTTCAFENTQHRFQWSSSKYTRVVSAKSEGTEGLVSAVSWRSRGEWRLAVSVERASCCVGPSVAVCVAVCERLRREVCGRCPGRGREAPATGIARSLGLASSRLLCVRVRVAAARRDVTTCMFGPGRARGRTEIREVNPKERKPVACARKAFRQAPRVGRGAGVCSRARDVLGPRARVPTRQCVSFPVFPGWVLRSSASGPASNLDCGCPFATRRRELGRARAINNREGL
jgi:hypothetical protein